MKHPTQADIAHLVGVSRATVSYVLSGRKGGAISVADETRQRVIEAAQQLGYEPDAAAQSLRLRTSKNIGFTMPDMNNPHLWQIVRGADETARAQGFNLLLTSTAMQPESEKASIREVLRRRIDGLILLQWDYDKLKDEFCLAAQRHSPIVVLGANEKYNLDTVTPGHMEGAKLMMTHLIQLAHRQIGFIFGVYQEPLGNERLLTYRTELKKVGIPLNEDLIVHCGAAIQDGYQAALTLLDKQPRPTAILVINDLLAIGALRAIANRGLRVPEDISVAGFDDIDMAGFTIPSLSTVCVNAEDVGREAVRLIFERLAEPERLPQHLYLPARLILRDSTGPAPICVDQRR